MVRIWYLQGQQESDKVLLFVVRKADAEPLVIEVDHGIEVLCRVVVEIGCPGRQRAEDGPLEPPDVFPLAGDQCATGVGRLDRLEWRRVVPKRVQRQVRRATRSVGQPDIERGWDRVIAGARCVVTGRA